MGIFDLFKKLVKRNKVEEVAIEKLVFSEIEGWMERTTRENEIKEKEILFVVGEKTGNFVKELGEKIVILQGFDVEAKKDKDNIKNIVTNSRKKYIESVEELIERLNNLEEPQLEKFIEKTNKIFFDFGKSSFRSYEMATILIGKEMASIKESLKVFSKALSKTFDGGNLLIYSFKNLLIIKEKLNKINQIDKTLERISEKKSNLNKKIGEKGEENKKLSEKIEEIMKSSNYLERLRIQKKIESLKEESKNDIFMLKQLIDFKALTNFYHIFENEMNTIKEYRENFRINFEKDNGKIIIDLLNKARLSNDAISEKVKQITAKIEETVNHEKNLKKDETHEEYLRLKEVNLEIGNLKIEKVKEEKRDEKLKTSKGELINVLKQELGRMNVEVI